MVTVLSAVGILLTVFIIILFHKEGYADSKSCIMRISRIAAKVTCSTHKLPSISRNKVVPSANEDDDTSSMKSDVFYDVPWKNVAIILDRFCFVLFSTVTVLMNLAFVIALVAGGSASNP